MTNEQIDAKRLAKLKRMKLDHGAHEHAARRMCAVGRVS